MINLTGSRANAKLQPAVILLFLHEEYVTVNCNFGSRQQTQMYILSYPVIVIHSTGTVFLCAKPKRHAVLYFYSIQRGYCEKRHRFGPSIWATKGPEKADALKTQPWNQDSLHLWDSHLQTQITIHFSQNPLPSSHT